MALYFLIPVIMGFYFYRKSRSTDGFTVAHRSLPGWLCGLSIFATNLSSLTFLAVPSKAYATNWNAFVFTLSLPIATWVAVRFFLPYYLRINEISAYAYLEHRFGPWARIYASVLFLLTQLARLGAIMYLMALPLNALLGWDIRLIILITGISVTLYSFVGGISAVIWADAFQAIILIAGAGFCVIFMLMGMPNGPSQIFEIGMDYHKFSLGSFSLSLSESTFWVVLAYGVAYNLQIFGIDQGIVQRYIAAASPREARKSIWWGGLLYIPVSVVFFFIGTELFAYYHAYPQKLDPVKETVAVQQLITEGITSNNTNDYKTFVDDKAHQLTSGDIGDKVFPHFIVCELPKGFVGLLIAAISAAAMSTIATSLNSSATLLMRDYYQRYLNQKATEKQSMYVLWGGTVLWGILGTGIALLFINITSALDAWWTLAGIFSGGMLGLFLLGLISRRVSNAAAVIGVVMGTLVICWMTVSPCLKGDFAWLSSPFNALLIPVFGTLAILFIGLLVNRFYKKTVCFNQDKLSP